MGKNKGFIGLLKNQGYEVHEKKLGGGFINDVRLITAYKGNRVFEYVLKRYGSRDDVGFMLDGYDKVFGAVRSPALVYVNRNEREVAYDLVKGKSLRHMIESQDNESDKAVTLLAQELQKLHEHKKKMSKYRRGDSPDERRSFRCALEACQAGNITRKEMDMIVKHIKSYEPSFKSIIHGDAHLGNFLYHNGEIYVIDTDSVKISDHNADIGKVIDSIDKSEHDGKITHLQSKELKELFLAAYAGEDERAVLLHQMRTPLRVMKGNDKDIFSERKRMIGALSGLEARVAVAIVFLFLALSLAISNGAGITGRVVLAGKSTALPFAAAAISLIGIITIYWVLQGSRKIND